MLPSILAKQLQQGIRDYIETTFPMTNTPFAGSLTSLFDEKDGVYHQPYISVKLPFRMADKMPGCFDGLKLPFMPYVHQEKAYERLTGEAGRSTLIATGTGSGKTECFLNPVLEYCYQHNGEPGIKALIIYPMNALATDQARRIAEAIYSSPKLLEGEKPKITVGMYVGGGKGKGATTMMKPDKKNNILGVITDHETMLNQAPDILLTNYKMLDYLLEKEVVNKSTGEKVTSLEAMMSAIVRKAISGHVESCKFVRSTIGQDPVTKIQETSSPSAICFRIVPPHPKVSSSG